MAEDVKKSSSKLLFDASIETWDNARQFGKVVCPYYSFSSPRWFQFHQPIFSISMGCDGVGTKVQLAAELSEKTGDFRYHRGIPGDAFEMAVGDMARNNIIPVCMTLDLSANTLDRRIAEELAAGIKKFAKEYKVAVINGETADMGGTHGGKFNYTLSASLTGIVNPSRVIYGQNIEPGHSIVSLKEEGLMSNGFTTTRKILSEVYGSNWHIAAFNGKKFAKLALMPSTNYSKPIFEMTGCYGKEPKAEISGIAHITGGGIPEKLSRALEFKGFGARIFNAFCPPDFVRCLQYIGGVSDEEAYRTWNMGNGMMIITNKPDKVIEISKKHKIDAKISGEVTEDPRIVIKSKGSFSRDKELIFN